MRPKLIFFGLRPEPTRPGDVPVSFDPLTGFVEVADQGIVNIVCKVGPEWSGMIPPTKIEARAFLADVAAESLDLDAILALEPLSIGSTVPSGPGTATIPMKGLKPFTSYAFAILAYYP